MNYQYFEITFPSSDEIHKIDAEIYMPKKRPIKGIIQLAHGMIDHVSRYAELADYFTAQGYIFAGNSHLGHGKSVSDESELGYFAKKDGVCYLIKDMHAMNKYLRSAYPELPLILMGHSMGSFLARLYAVRYPHTLSGLIIHGTSGPNHLVGMGKLLAGVTKLLHGDRHRSRLIAKMAFMGYNSRFSKEEGEWAWLTRDTERSLAKAKDPLGSFEFTVSGFCDLFDMLSRANARSWFESFPKDLPTLIISGENDPVGSYGKGPSYVYKQLMLGGAKHLTLKLYEGARHELFNETNRQEVCDYLAAWVNEATECERK